MDSRGARLLRETRDELLDFLADDQSFSVGIAPYCHRLKVRFGEDSAVSIVTLVAPIFDGSSQFKTSRATLLDIGDAVRVQTAATYESQAWTSQGMRARLAISLRLQDKIKITFNKPFEIGKVGGRE